MLGYGAQAASDARRTPGRYRVVLFGELERRFPVNRWERASIPQHDEANRSAAVDLLDHVFMARSDLRRRSGG
jgi:hypothetical protein